MTRPPANGHKPNIVELRKLVGNPTAYALQQKDGSYLPVREPLTPAVLKEHLAGDITVGTYIVKPPDQARTLVFDIDNEDDEEQLRQSKAIAKVLMELRLPYGMEFSGRKGFHVWVIAAQYTSAETLYRLGRGVRTEAGLPSLEVFPKQTRVRDLGNLVKLPGGVHRVTGQPNLFFYRPKVASVQALQAAAEKYPEARATGGTYEASIEYPCVSKIQEGVNEGGRNIHLFHLATMLRKFSIAPENIEIIINRANQLCDEPLDDEEVYNLMASSANSGPICDQVDEAYHCGDQCIKARHPGLYTRAGSLKWAADGEHVVLQVEGRSDRTISLLHPDIEQARAVLLEPKRQRRKDRNAE